ncbi:hypothetical protein Golob_013066 [Gossypium lobatum]|uniref:Uncharacterized protein n=1 Tax=Gossypium lobatum TaxID=34289 RepID=A0A7J8LN97_9ROSI|nr:hypothetical protein [Gossypium lobatum]
MGSRLIHPIWKFTLIMKTIGSIYFLIEQ